jgi:glycine C-acetyltransferase/8-amino-7-oxononanoate synthase
MRTFMTARNNNEAANKTELPSDASKQNVAFTKSLLHFVKPEGSQLQERSLPYHEWANERRRIGVWPFAKTLMGHVGHIANVANEFRENEHSCINFGSQDYLGMAQREELKEAVRLAMDEFGVHSAGSPVLCGRTRLLLELQDKFCKLLGRESCIIYPTGLHSAADRMCNLKEGRIYD